MDVNVFPKSICLCEIGKNWMLWALFLCLSCSTKYSFWSRSRVKQSSLCMRHVSVVVEISNIQAKLVWTQICLGLSLHNQVGSSCTYSDLSLLFSPKSSSAYSKGAIGLHNHVLDVSKYLKRVFLNLPKFFECAHFLLYRS